MRQWDFENATIGRRVVAIGLESGSAMSDQGGNNLIQDQLAGLFASLSGAVIVTDPDGTITLFNSHAEELLGYELEEMAGTPIARLFQDPETLNRLTEQSDSMADGRSMDCETFAVIKEGESVPVHVSMSGLFKRSQRIGRIIYLDAVQLEKRTEDRLTLLLAASNLIAKAKNLKEGLQGLAEMIVSMLSSTFCRILLIDEHEKYLVVKAAWHKKQPNDDFKWIALEDEQTPIDEWPGLRDRLEKGDATVLNQNDGQVSGNLEKLAKRLGLQKPIRSVISVPVKIDKKIVGLLVIGNLVGDAEALFDKQKRDLAAGIAAQVAALIKRLQLAEMTDRHRLLLKALDEALLHIRAEKERPKLLKEVVRLAATLVDCDVGGLYVNNPHLSDLELGAAYGLQPQELEEGRLAYDETLLASVAREGKPRSVSRDPASPASEPLFKIFGLETAFCVPLIQAGKVEAILFVGDTTGQKQLTDFDKEVLERFALHTAHALHTSELINQEQRLFSNYTTLLNVIEYIQGETDWDKMLHIMLVGVTAGYGLGFNRALLFLLDEGRNNLVGWTGIGQMTKPEALKAWQKDRDSGLYELSSYLKDLRREGLQQTALAEMVSNMRLPMAAETTDAFSQAVIKQSPVLVKVEKLSEQLPKTLLEAIDPTTDVVIIPLMTHKQVIGLLVADNKFTQAPITKTDIDLLMTFVGAAAIASDLEGQRLRSYFQASKSLAANDPEQVVHELIAQMRDAAKARWVCLVPTDERNLAQRAIMVGECAEAHIVAALKQNNDRGASDDDQPQRTLKLPMRMGGRQVGTMWFHYEESRQFPKFERDALQFYVNQAAVAYDSAQRLKKAENMRKAAEDLAAANDLKEVLRQIFHNAKLVMEADSAVIWSYDVDRDSFNLEISEGTGISTETLEEINNVQPKKGGTTYQVLHNGYVEVPEVNDFASHPFIGESVRKLLETFEARSFQGIVLKVRDKKIGVLYLNYKHRRKYDREDRRIAETFADHVALALTNAKLFDQFTQAKKAATEVAKFMVLSDPGDTLTSIVEGTQRVLGAAAVVLFTYDQASGQFNHPPTMIGVEYEDRAAVSEEKLTHSIVYMMLGLDEPYVVNNVADDPLFRGKRFAIDEQIKSCVAIPLRTARERVGVMFVNYRTPHHITSNDLDNLELFANYAAVAIYDAKLFTEQQARLKEKNSLVALTQTVLESLGSGDLEGIMETVVAAVATVLETEYCSIVQQDDNDRLVLRAAHGWPKSMIGNFTIEQNLGSQTGYTLQRQAPVRVYDYGTERRFTVPEVVSQYGIRSGISAPMIKGDKIVGAMLAHTKRLRRFTDAEEGLLSHVANFLATVISSARYEEIEPHYENLRSVYEASKAITTLSVESERKQILDRILQKAVECIRRRRNRDVVLGTIQLYNEQTQQLVFESIYPEESSKGYINIGMRWRVSEETSKKEIGVTGRALLTKEPQLVHNVNDLRGNGYYREYNRETQSELAMPMIDSRGRCLGVLDVESDKVGSFDEYDQDMMRLLAELAVIGIQSRQTMTKLMASSAIAWTGMSGSYWRHKILDEAILIKDHVTEIRSGLGPAHVKKIEKELNSIERHAKGIIDGYDTTKLTPETAAPQPVNAMLRDRIAKSTEYAHNIYKLVEVRFSLELSDDARVKVDPTWFSRPLDILFDNANRAMQDSAIKTLTIASREEGGFAVIGITDTGRGIPELVRSKLFVEPIKDSDMTGGLGVGLLMAGAIVEAYDGQIRMERSDSTGTTMVILLPLFKS